MRKKQPPLPVRFVREMVGLYFEKRVSRSAAELAYFLILSFFPVLICIHAFVGALHLDPDMVVRAAEAVLPQMSMGILGDYIQYITDNQSGAMVFTGISMTLVSASAALRALIAIMDDLYGHKARGGIRQVVFSVLFALLFLFIAYLSLAVVLTGNWLVHFLEATFRIKNPLETWWWMRFLLLFLFVLLFVLLVYRVAAPRGRPAAPIFTGAFLSAAVLVAASILFSWFMGISARYSLVYGSLASVIVLLVWLYLCGNILILGGVFNVVWHRHRSATIGG